MASRLIALDKCPGIGIGEVIRRIIGKAISITLKYDIQDAVGLVQLCASHDGGCEDAIHAMHQLFNNPHTNAVIHLMPSIVLTAEQLSGMFFIHAHHLPKSSSTLTLTYTSMEKLSCPKKAQPKSNGHVRHQHSSPH